jgi:EmrB/QacA subfamily drug resistance transporter
MTHVAAAKLHLAERGSVYVAFSGLMLALLLSALDATIVSTALPTIVGELGGLTHLSWVVTAYLLAQTVVTPIYGKLGDLHGRKGVLQGAIVVFLFGSALCGAARSLLALILFRALQGLGGGGLAVTSQAVVGDLVPPRERGRYQGIFGAVFGIASIAGPLLGGYFTTQLSWRWIFYVNLPLGAVALVVLGVTLPARRRGARRPIDVAGAMLLALALSAIILVTDLGGGTYPWSSPLILGLEAAAVVLLAAFVAAEARAAEPLVPLRLFRNADFSLTSAVGLIVGFALFGGVTYVPLFLQSVSGHSPTTSGLEMLPMMGGMLVTSILSGQIISRTGRYKVFPIAGMALITAGLVLLARMHPDTTTNYVLGALLVLGLGLGMVLQVLVIAVQNAVDYSDLGAATSGAMLFRLIGGSVGTAALGAIFAARLGGEPSASGLSPTMLADLDPALRATYAAVLSDALDTVFLVAAAVALVGTALALLLPERPLRRTVAASAADVGRDLGESFPMPTSDDPLPQVLRGLAALADRDVRRRAIEHVVHRAGLTLSPSAAWLLVRMGEDAWAAPPRLDDALGELRRAGLISEGATSGEAHVLTAAGLEALARLTEARRARLDEICAEWTPGTRADVAEVLGRLARQLVPEPPAAGRTGA